MASPPPHTCEDRIKHLEFIQNAILRMAGNSFLLKGWSITIAAAFFALAAKNSRPGFALLALFPTLSFWGLDAYYLRLERLFRELYDEVRLLPDEELSEKIGPFSLQTGSESGGVGSWFQALFSGSVVWLHVTIVVSIAALALALFFGRA
ncbi:MAG: hypothetical protein ACLQMT_14000 [Candidatus Acidiferrales bacterium]